MPHPYGQLQRRGRKLDLLKDEYFIIKRNLPKESQKQMAGHGLGEWGNAWRAGRARMFI